MSDENKDNKVDDSKLLEDLKIKADLLGIKYSPNIGLAKLKDKVDLFMQENTEETAPENEVSVGPNKSVFLAEQEARKPIYCVVKDLDASQQNDPTIVKNVGNKYFKIGCIVKKGVPQLVPAAILKAIRGATMIEWVNERHPITKRPTGNKVARTAKRYSVEILDENPDISKLK